MPIKKSIDEIKGELKPLEDYDVVVFGSYLKVQHHRSDIDIAVVTKEKDKERNLRIWNRLIGTVPGYYDLRIFELLPLHIQGQIIENYRVVYGNSPEISMYFYHYRKLWDDIKRRYYENQYKSVKEKLEAVERRKRALKDGL